VDVFQNYQTLYIDKKSLFGGLKIPKGKSCVKGFLSQLQIRHKGRATGRTFVVRGLWGEDRTPSGKERTFGPDNSYGFPGREIAIKGGGIDEEPREEKLLLAIR